jgi:hypothetical protein
MPNNPNKLSQLWARVVGLKEWNREADALHNTVGGDSPAPGDLPGQPTPRDYDQQVPLTAAERKQRYENWEGEDPGH